MTDLLGRCHRPSHPNRSQRRFLIGSTYAPYAVARRLALAVGGRLVTYLGYVHSWLLNGSPNICMQQVLSSYLIDGALPALARAVLPQVITEVTSSHRRSEVIEQDAGLFATLNRAHSPQMFQMSEGLGFGHGAP